MPGTSLGELRDIEKEESRLASQMEREIHAMKQAVHIFRIKKGLLKMMKGEAKNFPALAQRYHYFCQQQWKILQGEKSELEAEISRTGGKFLHFEKTLGSTELDIRIRAMVGNLLGGMKDIESSFNAMINAIVGQREMTHPRSASPNNLPMIEEKLGLEWALLGRELNLLSMEEKEAIEAERMTRQEEAPVKSRMGIGRILGIFR